MSCGHEETHQLYGPYKDRDRKAEWLASNLCEDCKQTARDKANQEAAEANSGNGLPELTGSEKQVNWAESIRAEKLADYDALIEQMDNAPDGQSEQADDARRILKDIRNETSAGWWIDERNYTLTQMLKQAYKQQMA
jgi:hypothetical protein